VKENVAQDVAFVPYQRVAVLATTIDWRRSFFPSRRRNYLLLP